MSSKSKILRVCQCLPALALLTVAATAVGEECRARSGAGTTALLELYTSEGCNSCPPADRWLNALAIKGFTSDKLVPLALHVDYWNYLGWPDPFSQEIFSRRQRDLGSHNRAPTVYTPEFFLNGGEYRGWSRKNLATHLTRINGEPARASIDLTLARSAPGARAFRVSGLVEIHEANERQQSELYLALYENKLSSRVTAGENNGRTLSHDFVVRRLLGPYPIEFSGPTRLQTNIPLEPGWKINDLGVVAFVQHHTTAKVLQAVSLPVCSGKRQ